MLLLAFVLVFNSCKKTDISGDSRDNLAPQTYTIADTIDRSGNDRFNTRLRVQWWGDDPDGYVTSFEYTFDSTIGPNTVWSISLSSDTVFSLALPPGRDTLNVNFWVRAIDNLGLRDESPASLWYPIKNTKPTIEFVKKPSNANPLAGGIQLFSFPILRFDWEAADEDGVENLKHFEVYLNDTNSSPLILENIFSGMTIEAKDLSASVSDCDVYPGKTRQLHNEALEGLILEDSNVLYIRAVDLSEAKSDFAISDKIFVRKPSSDFLLVNAISNPGGSEDAFYTAKLNQIGITNYDRLNLFDKDANGNFRQISPDNETQSRIFKLFKHILWYGDDLDFSIVYAQGTLSEFTDDGGNIFLSSRVSGQSPVSSSFYQVSPIDSLYKPETNKSWLMTDTSKLQPVVGIYPRLEYSEFLSVARPVRFVNGTSVLYRAEMLERDNVTFKINQFKGNSDVIGLRENSVTGSKFVFSALALDKLDKANNVHILLERILKDEFGIN